MEAVLSVSKDISIALVYFLHLASYHRKEVHLNDKIEGRKGILMPHFDKLQTFLGQCSAG